MKKKKNSFQGNRKANFLRSCKKDFTQQIFVEIRVNELRIQLCKKVMGFLFVCTALK